MKPTEQADFEGAKITVRAASINENDFPLMPALSAGKCALAVIVGVEGPSYRRCGAAMIVDASGRSWGNLSSGCIDKNVALNAKSAMETGNSMQVRYGRGSPYWDLPLPCGGALDIQIFPYPDKMVLNALAEKLKARESAVLTLGEDGTLSLNPTGMGLHLTILPQIRVLVFGTGMEVICFTELAVAAGCRVELFSPDPDVLTHFSWANPLVKDDWPEGVVIDERTAVVTFFHDHNREPSILTEALNSHAFFVGAQGSRRAHATRCQELVNNGCPVAGIDKLKFPLGLIPSTRDPYTLGVSVLAHILQNVKDSTAPQILANEIK
ncbi:XdhC family protein [Ochrobactrum sp. Marseille-Q0166]|uniref:XdhC family protein n=1 Tax=Ochrobactrum sp. Marseille-Q0166 TaxID=2761105 RepID=UPI001656390A|nr:XdhC family protein [Ochrobactrum sp. Marseille-Q0166]MBC8719732.1 XdhC family protein [Ochrobactrum sp. Marseille-Q0166]